MVFQKVICASAACAAVLLAGCADPGENLAAALQSELASTRADACVRAGQEENKSVVPLLVERLEDSDADVRLFAIIALEKITGQSLGYKYFAAAGQRSEAVRRWRNWLERRRSQGGGS